jgi:hypothetical protein
MIEMLRQQKFKDISYHHPHSLLDVWCSQRALVDESGVLELGWGRTISQSGRNARDALFDTTQQQ